MALDSYPELGTNVDATLVNGSVFTAYWDGIQWWVGVPDDPNDLPLVNEYVVSWSPKV